jgi:hypothetical protein
MKELQIHRPELFEGSLTTPCVRISCFLPTRVESTAVSDAVSRYFSLIPEDVVLQRVLVDEVEGEPSEADVRFVELSPTFLEDLSAEYDEAFSRTDGSEHVVRFAPPNDLEPTGFSAMSFFAMPPDRVFRNWRNLLSFDLELTFARSRIEDIYRFVTDTASAFPDCCLTAAAALNFPAGLDQLLMNDINARLFRFIALDANYYATHYSIGDRVPFAAWLTYLNQSQIERLGGLSGISGALTSDSLAVLGSGALLRAARLPPIADVNRGAPDIGWLPRFDRLLADVICRDPETFRRFSSEDASRWFDRFIDRDDGEWENADLVPYRKSE